MPANSRRDLIRSLKGYSKHVLFLLPAMQKFMFRFVAIVALHVACRGSLCLHIIVSCTCGKGAQEEREVCLLQHHLLLGATLRSLCLLSSLNTKAANLIQNWYLRIKVHGVTQTFSWPELWQTDRLHVLLCRSEKEEQRNGNERETNIGKETR